MRIVVLRHPQEQKDDRGSADLLVENFPSAVIKDGLSWRNLGKAIGEEKPNPKQWVVLYLGSALSKNVKLKPGFYFVSNKGNVKDTPNENIVGCILLDGTWSQAKTLWWRNAWLLKLHRAVLIPSAPSLYGRRRKEPRKECLSTIESAAAFLDYIGAEVDAQQLRNKFAEFVKTI